MATVTRTGMHIPLRPAPKAPGLSDSNTAQKGVILRDRSVPSSALQRPAFCPRSISIHGEPNMTTGKKKPPPRPPPPNFAKLNTNPNKGSSNKRGSILTRFIGGGGNKQSKQSTHCSPIARSTSVNSHFYDAGKENEKPLSTRIANAPLSPLIDLHSPPSSPTPTSLSGSDGVSVNSFGSDSTGSNNGHSLFSSGNTSQGESGFEDDFDPFTAVFSQAQKPSSLNVKASVSKSESCSSAPSSRPSSAQPSNLNLLEDIFGSTPALGSVGSTHSHSWNQLQPTARPRKQKPTIESTTPLSMGVMPTIIRPKQKQVLKNGFSMNSNVVRSKTCSALSSTDWSTFDDSPPMPSVPPPPPPDDFVLSSVPENEPPPELPPRPTRIQDTDLEKPYAVALYEYPASQSEDLPFQPKDVIFLLHRVNSDWLFGQCGTQKGMFPSSFVNVIVPLPDEKLDPYEVTALYTFVPESFEDLAFQEGDKIHILKQLNDDWLFGECGGQQGQFPVTFIDRIPPNLPQA